MKLAQLLRRQAVKPKEARLTKRMPQRTLAPARKRGMKNRRVVELDRTQFSWWGGGLKVSIHDLVRELHVTKGIRVRTE